MTVVLIFRKVDVTLIKMKLKFKISTNKSKLECVDISEPFEKSLDEYKKYIFDFSIDVYVGKSRAAIISGYILDEDKIINDNENLVTVADMHSAELLGAMEALFYSSIIEKELKDDFIGVPVYRFLSNFKQNNNRRVLV